MSVYAAVDYDEAILMAARAFAVGQATEGQQRVLYEWLMFKACDIAGVSFAIGGEDGKRLTDFHQGRQYPARQLAYLQKPEALLALRKRKRTPRVQKEATEAKTE